MSRPRPIPMTEWEQEFCEFVERFPLFDEDDFSVDLDPGPEDVPAKDSPPWWHNQ